MRTHLTYEFYEGNIWRWSQTGIFKVHMEPIMVCRESAEKQLEQWTESASHPDYFAKRAAELRDEVADAIREYDEFHQEYQPSKDPGSYGMGKENNHGCHV